jgi:hypothetical protein
MDKLKKLRFILGLILKVTCISIFRKRNTNEKHVEGALKKKKVRYLIMKCFSVIGLKENKWKSIKIIVVTKSQKLFDL